MAGQSAPTAPSPARDYDPTAGRFNSLDPVAQDVTDPYVSEYLYANNQPTVLTDPSGQCPVCVMALGAILGGGIDLGIQVATNLINGCDPFYNINWTSVAVSAVMGAIGSSGALAEVLRLERAAGGVGDAARFAVSASGETTMFLRAGSTSLEVSEHAAMRMAERGVSIEAAETTLTQTPFRYFHQKVWKTGYYDPASRLFLGTVNGRITTVITRATPAYINNLKAALP